MEHHRKLERTPFTLVGNLAQLAALEKSDSKRKMMVIECLGTQAIERLGTQATKKSEYLVNPAMSVYFSVTFHILSVVLIQNLAVKPT